MRWSRQMCFVLFVCGFVAGCENSLESIKDKRVIRIGVLYDLPPFSYVDSRGEFGGLEVQLGRKIAKDLLGDESRAEFVAIENRVQESGLLDSGAIDIALSCTSEADTTATSTESMPYMHAAISVVGRVGSPSGIQALLSPARLARLLVREDSPAQAYFAENYPQIPLATCESLAHCVQTLRQSQATSHDQALYFADLDIIAMLFVRENPDFTLIAESLGDPKPCVPRVKGAHTSLKTWLDKEIVTLHKEGVLNQSFFSQAFQSALERTQTEPKP